MECVEDDQISLIIDNREQHILKEMKTPEFVNLNPLVKFTTANLDIGDFKISIQNTHILIERKTIDDLIASIKDGRYKKQKCRLINECQKNVKVIYLIEGDIWKSKKFKPDTLFSVVVNTMIRDNIYTYISKDIHHTILFLCKIYKQIWKNKKDYIHNPIEGVIQQQEDTSYAKYISPNKKSNLTPKICFINQLRQIPGISYNIACEIVTKYPTTRDLVLNAKYEELIELRINDRRISKNIAKFLIEFYN